MSTHPPLDTDAATEGASSDPSRRRFLTYLMATPTLAVAVNAGVFEQQADAVIPTPPQPRKSSC